ESAVDESTWANLGAIGQHIANTTPDFDPRNFGFTKLSDLLVATEAYEVKTRFNDEYSSTKSLYVRPKQKRRNDN
ncbi:MAG: OST-HTH/LOTUS domain-containing protein, partial [Thiovulaceae bacterium]|nr:OST-HTH/LOTUS domain-containing protein [Sulfurimonadaceae bacterium]